MLLYYHLKVVNTNVVYLLKINPDVRENLSYIIGRHDLLGIKSFHTKCIAYFIFAHIPLQYSMTSHKRIYKKKDART